jgi:hypothetical protein
MWLRAAPKGAALFLLGVMMCVTLSGSANADRSEGLLY